MKASEIVDKLKSVLLSSEEEKVEVKNPVHLEEMPQEAPVEDVLEEVVEEEMKYATKEELESAIAEMKAMYEAIIEKMGSKEMEVEVPTEELAKEELSSQEPAAQPITHSPEVEESAKLNFFAQAKPRNTMSVVYEKMFNK
jgi:formate dehydrogenase maturation protein FdhE